MLLDDLGRGADDVLPLPVLEQVEGLQRRGDVALLEPRRARDVLDRYAPLVPVEHLEHLPAPETPVRHLTKVRQGPLRGPNLPFAPGNLVRHGDQEAAVPLALVRRQRQDARQVVILVGALLLAEVPNHRVFVGSLVELGHDVEQERIHVKVQSLVVQEQLGQQAQVLAVHLVRVPVDLPKRQPRFALVVPRVPVNHAPGRVGHPAPRLVLQQRHLVLHVLQTVLAHVEFRAVRVLRRVRGKIPRVNLEPPKLHAPDVLHLGLLVVLLLQLLVDGREVLDGPGDVVDLVVPPLEVARHLASLRRGSIPEVDRIFPRRR
mmetsp:Transcript_10752/g.46588  ORF Transcript_10752/g.46588 Transcript_10752/m.46588 type:complete len:318 (-) Transcript_10752:532-1485(-)